MEQLGRGALNDLLTSAKTEVQDLLAHRDQLHLELTGLNNELTHFRKASSVVNDQLTTLSSQIFETFDNSLEKCFLLRNRISVLRRYGFIKCSLQNLEYCEANYRSIINILLIKKNIEAPNFDLEPSALLTYSQQLLQERAILIVFINCSQTPQSLKAHIISIILRLSELIYSWLGNSLKTFGYPLICRATKFSFKSQDRSLFSDILRRYLTLREFTKELDVGTDTDTIESIVLLFFEPLIKRYLYHFLGAKPSNNIHRVHFPGLKIARMGI